MAKKDNYVPDDETLQSKQVDGRFVTPWGGGRPSLNAVFRWLLIEKRERNIGKAEVQMNSDYDDVGDYHDGDDDIAYFKMKMKCFWC